MLNILYFLLKIFSNIHNAFGFQSVDFSTNVLSISEWKKKYSYFFVMSLLGGMILDIRETLVVNPNTIAMYFIAIYVVETITAVIAVLLENNYKISDKVKTFKNIVKIDELLRINKKNHRLLIWKIAFQNILYSVFTVFIVIFDIWVWHYNMAELVLFIRSICIEVNSIQLTCMIRLNNFYLREMNKNLKILCKRHTLTTKICDYDAKHVNINIFSLMTFYDNLADNISIIMDRMKFTVNFYSF